MKNIACIDVGLKRIGLAISLKNGIVFPQDGILRKNRNQSARTVNEFLKRWEIEILVVGLPKGASSEEEMERRIKHFVSLLDTNDIEVVFQNEYGSSMEAQEMTKGIFKHRKDGKIDSISAKIILERFLDENKSDI